MEKIIVKLIKKAEKEIHKELKKIEKDIDDFSKPTPIPSVTNIQERENYFRERISGRLSTDKLRKNYDRRGELEKQLTEIANYKWQHKEDFKLNSEAGK